MLKWGTKGLGTILDTPDELTLSGYNHTYLKRGKLDQNKYSLQNKASMK